MYKHYRTGNIIEAWAVVHNVNSLLKYNYFQNKGETGILCACTLMWNENPFLWITKYFDL